MIPISVLIIHRDNDNYRHLSGWWSYPVDEFVWQTLKVKPEGFIVDMKYAPMVDMVVMEDWIYGQVKNLHVPMAYVVVDSPRSRMQLDRNRSQAQDASLILVDSDKLESFDGLGKQARRFAHAVNDHLFIPRDKVYDVAFLCWPTDDRRMVQRWCFDICKRHEWTFATGTYDWADYAHILSSAKVVVHRAHVVNGRSWRVFDVMASRGCLLSSPLPEVSGDGLISGKHYREYTSAETLDRQLTDLLNGDTWESIADEGYRHVMANHTWRKRATQLRQTVNEVFRW